MPTAGLIRDVVPGDDWRQTWLTPNVPAGDQEDSAKLIIKDTAFDLDADALIIRTITTNLVAGQGQITDMGSVTGIAVEQWQIPAASTATLRAGRSYYYKKQVHLLAANRWQTVETGQLIPWV